MLRFVFVLALALLPVVVQAQPYVIDAIEVAPGSRVPVELVRAETRLTIGNSYTEEDLRQAVYRIRRLPFVLKADYAVDGRTLVITIADIKPFFFEIDVEGFVFGSSGGGVLGAVEVGGRLFAGSRGVFEGTLGTRLASGSSGDFRDVTLSYTAYDLFGSRAWVTAGLTKSIVGEGGTDEISPRLTIGVPIGRTQSIIGSATRFADSTDRVINRVPVTTEFESTSAQVSWVRDTTDDPYFARRGTQLSAGPTWRRNSSTFPVFSGGTVIRLDRRTTETTGVLGTAAYYRPITQSLIGWGRGEISHSESEANSIAGSPNIPNATENEAQVTVGLGRNFGDRGRWELGLGGEWRTFEQGLSDSSRTGAVAFAGATTRTRWGVFRLKFTYGTE